MKLIGVLCWYDEDPLWLSQLVTSLAGVVDHLVAVDGAYMLLPHGKPRSADEQMSAITAMAAAARIGLTLHRPTEVWPGNEVEKRTASLRLAELASSEDDWYFVIDADEIVTQASPMLRHDLERCTELVAECGFSDGEMSSVPRGTSRLKRLYRAMRGLRYEEAHYVVAFDRDDETVYLGGQPNLHHPVPAADLSSSLAIRHRNAHREPDRKRQALDYYAARDRVGAESFGGVLMESVEGGLAPVVRAAG